MGDPFAELHRAEALAAGGDYPGAVATCDAHLASHPRDLRGILMKSSFLARAGFDEESRKVLRSAADLHPEVPELTRTLGLALLKSGHPSEAADVFQEALRRDSHDSSASAARGAALLAAGRTREGIVALRETLELDPERADALNNLGVAHLALGQIKPAALYLERAAKHFESPRILLNLGTVQEAENKRREAVGAYDQVLRLRPKDREGRAGRKRLAPPTKSKRRPKKAPARSSKKAVPPKPPRSRPDSEETPGT
jgi:Flp pilus assembly protein TadD